MRLVDLLAVYGSLGVASAVAVYRSAPIRDSRSLASALLCLPLWPLWAPVALSNPRVETSSSPPNEAAARVHQALREGIEACVGTALEPMLSRDAAARIGAEVDRAAARLTELDRALLKGDFDLEKAQAKLQTLETQKASPRAVATARLHLDNARRLHAMKRRDAAALEELADLTQALKAQLVVARLAGSSFEGVNAIVSEVLARVEGLSALDEELPST